MAVPEDDSDIFQHFDLGQVPIAVYCVAPDGRLIYGNRLLRQLLGLPLDGPLQANAVDFYLDPLQRPVLLQRAVEADQQGQLEHDAIALRVSDQIFYVEDFCRPMRDPVTQAIIGYVGCLVDITHEHEDKLREERLHREVSEVISDIGRVLHSNNSTLVMVTKTLEAVAQTLEPNPFQGLALPTADQIEDELTRAAQSLANAIEYLLDAAPADRRANALPEPDWNQLAQQIAMLRDFKQTVKVPEAFPSTLRLSGHVVSEIGRKIRPGSLSREAVRNMTQAAAQLERLASLIMTLQTRLVVIQMDVSLRTLRDYLTGNVRSAEDRQRMLLKQLVQAAIKQLAEFARTSNVEIIVSDQADKAEVIVKEREMTRAVSNLLHNAIKYTWRRDRNKQPWVMIRLLDRGPEVCIEFENWGVAIARSEIDSDLVFQLGYRGKWSTDRGRLGTGIGLTDARREARLHGGEVTIDSRPAHDTQRDDEDDAEYYRQPFITTATLFLPKADI